MVYQDQKFDLSKNGVPEAVALTSSEICENKILHNKIQRQSVKFYNKYNRIYKDESNARIPILL